MTNICPTCKSELKSTHSIEYYLSKAKFPGLSEAEKHELAQLQLSEDISVKNNGR